MKKKKSTVLALSLVVDENESGGSLYSLHVMVIVIAIPNALPSLVVIFNCIFSLCFFFSLWYGKLECYLDWSNLQFTSNQFPLTMLNRCSNRIFESLNQHVYLDAIASPSNYPCQWVGQSVIDSFRCDAIASPSFASLITWSNLIFNSSQSNRYWTSILVQFWGSPHAKLINSQILRKKHSETFTSILDWVFNWVILSVSGIALRPQTTDMRRSRQYVIFYHTWFWGFTTGIPKKLCFWKNVSDCSGLVPVVCLIFLNTKIYLAMKKLRFSNHDFYF